MKRDTILIFEDNEIDREILVELFRKDYKILEAANGKEGIALLNANFASIAIVLLDNLMPCHGRIYGAGAFEREKCPE